MKYSIVTIKSLLEKDLNFKVYSIVNTEGRIYITIGHLEEAISFPEYLSLDNIRFLFTGIRIGLHTDSDWRIVS